MTLKAQSTSYSYSYFLSLRLKCTIDDCIDRKLYPNVDFYSGIIYKALDIPNEMFTVMFALGRLPGWVAHWREMRLRKEPIGRPRQVYIGKNLRTFTDIKSR